MTLIATQKTARTRDDGNRITQRHPTIALWEFYDQSGKFLVAGWVALLSLAARNSVTSRQFRCRRWCNRCAAAQFTRRISSRICARTVYEYVPCVHTRMYVRACMNACVSQPVAKIDVTGRPTDDLGPVPTADISTASSGSTYEQEFSA